METPAEAEAERKLGGWVTLARIHNGIQWMGVGSGRGREELLTLRSTEAISNERAVFMFDDGKGGGTTC